MIKFYILTFVNLRFYKISLENETTKISSFFYNKAVLNKYKKKFQFLCILNIFYYYLE